MRGREVEASWCDDCEVSVPPARGMCPRCGRMVGVPRPVGRSESVDRAAPPAEVGSDESASTALPAVSLEVLEPIDVLAAVAVLLVTAAAVAVVVAGV